MRPARPDFRPIVAWLDARPRRTGRATTLILLALFAVVAAASALA
jgi:hypothetical protein